jgi:hypothetical protein
MAARGVDDAAGTIERMRAGLAGPELRPDALLSDPAYAAPAVSEARYGDDRDAYDEDYDYYWGGVRLPLWLALIWQVPWRQRLDIFVIGFVVGLIVAGIAVFWGLLLAQY